MIQRKNFLNQGAVFFHNYPPFENLKNQKLIYYFFKILSIYKIISYKIISKSENNCPGFFIKTSDFVILEKGGPFLIFSIKRERELKLP